MSQFERQEEQRRILRAQMGDEGALEQLIKAYRESIRREAGRFQVPGIVTVGIRPIGASCGLRAC